MERRTITITIIFLIIIGVIAGIVLLHSNSGCKDFRVVSICPTSNLVIINTTGSCSSVRIDLIDSSGVARASFTAPVGQRVSLNITPNAPPGNYTMRVKYKGKVIDEASIRVYEAPFIAHARALALPNGTIIITFLSHSPPCLKNYGVSAVIVLVNGTKHTYTGHWIQGEDIRLNLGVTITPKTNIQVIVVDSLGRYYNAGVARPI